MITILILKVSEYDPLPKLICELCLNQITSNYTFKQQCIENENKLLDYLAVQFKTEEYVKKEEELSDLELTNNFGIENQSDSDDKDDIKLSDLIEVLTENKSKKRKHIRKRPKPEEDLENAKYKCDECGSKFLKKSGLDSHIRLEHSNRKYKCNECDKTFILLGCLKNHQLSHGFNCKICLRSFSTENELDEHKLEHNNQQAFVCKECGKEFAKKVKLKLHLRVRISMRSNPFK